MRILALAAHPDDLEILCAGTLVRFVAEGHDVVAPIYYMDTLMGVGFQPVDYVDVSEVIETKVAMLEAHASQVTWLRDHDGVDIVDQMRTMTRFRGQQCGVEYAEGFVPCRTWLRTRPRRSLP